MNFELIQSVAIILSQFAVPAIDRDEPDRNQRLTVIATSIGRASERATCTGEWHAESCKPIAADANQVAAELIVIANEETHLRSNVHRDECKAHECDPVKNRVGGTTVVIHRARSLWQLHKAPAWSPDKWQSLSGATQVATDASAWEAAKLLAGYHAKCSTTEGAIAAFATGGICFHKSAAARAAKVISIKGRLARLQVSSESLEQRRFGK